MRKGYFFTLDAFVAAGIVMIGLFLILNAYSFRLSGVQPSTTSNDLLLALSNTLINEVNHEVVKNLIAEGKITDVDNSILQQAAEFYYRQDNYAAYLLLNATAYNLVPVQYGFNISIDRTPIYYKGRLSGSSPLIVSSRTIVFGAWKGSMWGPYTAEVTIWQ